MSISRTAILPRTEFVRDARLFVIAVEGEKTEVQYFSDFGNTRVKVEILSAGTKGLSAPNHILERIVKFEEENDLGPEDERWLVFDVDRQRKHFLNEVAKVARESGYNLAISNPCFELWLLLHFQDADLADVDCAAVIARLRPHIGGYKKSKINLEAYTANKTNEAVTRARALEGKQGTRWPGFPGTHVFKLVEALLHFHSG